MIRDRYGRLWDLPLEGLCPECRQPDNCGDCTHGRLTDEDVKELGGFVGDGATPSPETVWILTYEHKHGLDVSAYRSEGGATNVAFELASNRVEEGVWCDEDIAQFNAAETIEDALVVFHDVELGYSYSESLEIKQVQLGD